MRRLTSSAADAICGSAENFVGREGARSVGYAGVEKTAGRHWQCRFSSITSVHARCERSTEGQWSDLLLSDQRVSGALAIDSWNRGKGRLRAEDRRPDRAGKRKLVLKPGKAPSARPSATAKSASPLVVVNRTNPS